MADYFFLIDSAQFEERIAPELGRAWQRRSFGPARDLCQSLLPSAQEYAERYRIGPDPLLLVQLAREHMSFDRTLWRQLVSEVFLVAAAEIPEFQLFARTWIWLLAPRSVAGERSAFAPIQQMLLGSRDVRLGLASYRPDAAGLNDVHDVARLAEYCASVHPETWHSEALSGLGDLDSEDCADELAGAQEWFPSLRDMYQRAAERQYVVVHESIW